MIIIDLVPIAVCAVLMRVKGGGHGAVKRYFGRKIGILYTPDNHTIKPLNWPQYIYDRLTDGKILSTAGFGLLCLFYVTPILALTGALGWLVGVSSEIGQKMDALRTGDWHPALQRGVFLGAMVCLGLWNPAFIVAGATFPVWYWLSEKVEKEWIVAEYALGASIGIAFSF